MATMAAFLSVILWSISACARGSSCGMDDLLYFPNITENQLQAYYIHNNSNYFDTENRNNLFLYSSPYDQDDNICQNYFFVIRFCVIILEGAFNRTVLIREALLREAEDSLVTVNFTRTRVEFAAKEPCIQLSTSQDLWLCCNNFTISYNQWITNQDILYGISIAGQVLTINNSESYDFNPQRCSNINFNRNPVFPLTRCETTSLPLIRFHSIYIGANRELNLGGILGGSLTAALIISLAVAVLVFLICWVKSKRKSQILKQERHVSFAISAEYAEIGPSTPGNFSDHSCKHVRYAEQGADSSYEQYEFEEDNPYIVPPFEEESLYEHVKNGKIKHLSRDSIKLCGLLGSGEFGEVFEGILNDQDGKESVAVKTLKTGTESKDRVRFLQEAFIMSQFKDPNVVTMHGAVTDGEPVLLVLELLPGGDLRNHLVKMQSIDDVNSSTLDDHTLLSYCRQVVSGMVYLSSKHFVHRDLAARNILLSVDGICKIADFGMSRDLLYESYYVSHGGLIPVKWTAPEALHYKKYSTASDVWSYGAVMYEIWSVGCKPFENLPNNKVLSLLESGYRLPPPPGCPRMIYKIMIDCWNSEPSKRPSFLDLRGTLSLPDSKLLKWSGGGGNAIIPSEVTSLGAPLSYGNELYTDLQTTYKKI